jgi:hypothetical protein
MNKILNNAEKNKLIGASKAPSYKRGGASAPTYLSKKSGCGCKK